MLEQGVDEEMLLPGYQRVINGGSAQIHSSHYLHSALSLAFRFGPKLSE
jgi:hypothetical protein